jgi:hypothetical protein
MSSIPSTANCQSAIVRALTRLGGEANRRDIVALAAEIGAFSALERTTPPPPSHRSYGTYLAYKLSWAITQLRKQGAITRVGPSRWRLVNATD